MFPRTILRKIDLYLHTRDILLFYGARQVGKTSLMKMIQSTTQERKSYFFDLENPDYFELLEQGPTQFIAYLKSYYGWEESTQILVFIDEVQYLSHPTQLLKYLHDHYENIKLIVSGSSTLEIRGKLQDSLVGRMLRFDIYPLSFEEFLVFKGKENLSKMLGTKQQLSLIQNEMAFFYQEYAQFGGYPKVVLASSAEMKREYLKQIYESYIQKDIKDIGKIKEVEKFNKLIRLLANQSGNLLNLSEISNTIDVTQKTVSEWIFLLENTFVLQLVTPFSTNLRGELTKMPKVFFLDNGLRNYCDKDFELSGNSFENAFFSTVHHSYRFQELHFYRTQDKKEVDFVLDGKGYELKLSYNGKNLTSLDYFIGKLGLSGAIVTLEKRNNPKYEILYPWEV